MRTILMLRDLFDLFFVHRIREGQIKNFFRSFLMRRIDLSFYGLANKGDTVLQCGCYMIETVTKWSQAVGPMGRVIAIEADKDNAERLRYDVNRRELGNVLVINKGIWKDKGELTLEISNLSYRNKLKEQSSYSDILSEKDYDCFERIKVDAIDNILEEHGIKKVNLVYFSISGAEREALEGMRETLRNLKPRLWIRSILLDNKTNKPIIYNVAKVLKDNNYKVTLGRREKKRHGGNLFAYHK